VSPDKEEVLGLVGVGVMGIGLLSNLIKRFQVMIYDIDDARLKIAIEIGGKKAESLEMLAQCTDLIILSLPGPEQVNSVVNSLLLSGFSGTIIDTSTNDPETSVEIFEKCSVKEVMYVASPVIGGEKGAKLGELTVIVGLPEQKGSKLDIIMNLIGKNIFYVNNPRAASAIKLINNFMSIGNTLILAEALTLAQAEDIPLDLLHNVIKYGSGYSVAYERRWKNNISVDNYMPGYSISLAKKDLRLIGKIAEANGLSLIFPYLSMNALEYVARDTSKDISWLVKVYMDLKKKG